MNQCCAKKKLAELEALVSMIGSGSGGLRARVLFGNRAKEIAHEANGFPPRATGILDALMVLWQARLLFD